MCVSQNNCHIQTTDSFLAAEDIILQCKWNDVCKALVLWSISPLSLFKYIVLFSGV